MGLEIASGEGGVIGEVVEVTPEEVNNLGESILAKEEVRKELTGVRRGGSRRGRGGPRQ